MIDYGEEQEMVSVNGVSSIEYKGNVTTKSKAATNASAASFESYLGESMSMDKIFDAAAEKYNVPVELLKAIGKQESGFDAKAVSRCGAQGVMQLMPATAKELGVTDAFNAEQNIMGGSKYIAGLMKKYDGNVKLALAAYNAGSGNVAKYGGIPPFEETQNYVKKVIGYMKGTDQSGSTSSVSSGNNEIANPVSKVETATPTQDVNETNVAVTAAEINLTVDNSLNSIENVFTYDDYLNFIEKFLQGQKEKETEEDSGYYAAQQINYNIPVMNLLSSTKI
jgi:hypothetical protein